MVRALEQGAVPLGVGAARWPQRHTPTFTEHVCCSGSCFPLIFPTVFREVTTMLLFIYEETGPKV